MTKINLREPLAWLIIVIMGLFIAYQCKSSKVDRLERSEDARLHQERVKGLEQQAASAGHRADELASSRGKLRDSVKIVLWASNDQIQTYKKTIARLRPLVAVRIDTIPDLRDFVAALDSTVAEQDTLIQSLQLAHSAEIVSYELELKERGRQILAKESIQVALEERLVSLERENRKQRRKTGFWKIVAGVAVGTTVYLAVKTAD